MQPPPFCSTTSEDGYYCRTMRVFVLCTGRTGSVTFAHAASHATNFSVGHESQIGLARDRLNYPDAHIEVDNRLSWFTGSLGKMYPDAFYVHLVRAEDEVVASYRRRSVDAWSAHRRFRFDLRRIASRARETSIVDAFGHGILGRSRPWRHDEIDDTLRLFYQTVNDNISAHVMTRQHIVVDLATLPDQFPTFWEAIGAEGDLDKAMESLHVRRNISRP